MRFPILPDQASAVAENTDNLYWALICLSALVILIILIPMTIFLFKYRHGKQADRTPRHLNEYAFEITWTLGSLVLMMGLFAWGANLYYQIERPPPDAMEINVVGKQWMWKIEHPEGNREINQLHVPVGRVVKLIMASQDVIHSFFLPEFRVKQDVVPGRFTTLWFKARKPGTYHIFCAQYCGTAHSKMIGEVIVMSPDAFQQWLSRGKPDTTLVQNGGRLFRELGCSGCHVGQSVVRAPPLEGLFGKPVPLQGGDVVTADEGYIRDSILFPGKQIVAGYANDMPSFNKHVSEEELLELVAYIKSLGAQAPPPNKVTAATPNVPPK